jgi:hypothetical protein
MAVLRRIMVLVVGLALAAGFAAAGSSGKFEFGFHYGSWSLNLIKPLIEGLADDLGVEMKNTQMDKIREERPEIDIREMSFANDIDFDSSGHTFGFDVRWYPGGSDGSFSLGLSVVKTRMKFGISNMDTRLVLENVNTHEEIGFVAAASGDVTADPLAFLFSLRWDIAPRAVIHPYITLGFGAAGVSALDETTMRYNFEGTLTVPGEPSDTISESGTKTLLQLKEEDPFDYPIKFFPFFQFHLGLKAKIARSVHLLVDFGVLDGFALRGGLVARI